MSENKTRYWIVLIIFVVLSTAAIPLVSSQATPSPMVEIRNPSDRVDVYAYKNLIEGSSSGLEDHNLHLYLLVRPLDTPFGMSNLILS